MKECFKLEAKALVCITDDIHAVYSKKVVSPRVIFFLKYVRTLLCQHLIILNFSLKSQ
jgi:hypothetical protein